MSTQCLIATSAIIVYHLFWGTLYSNSGIKSIFFFLMSFWIGFRSLIGVHSICSTKRFILISARTYMGSLTCIFRVINYFSVTASTTSLTIPKVTLHSWVALGNNIEFLDIWCNFCSIESIQKINWKLCGKNFMQIFGEEEGVPHDQDFRGMNFW